MGSRSLENKTVKLFIFFLLFSAGCSQKETVSSTVVSSEKTNIDTRETMTNFTLDAYAHGTRQWWLEGEKAIIDEAAHHVSVGKPRILVYENNTKVSQMSAEHADIDTETKNIFATGKVSMSSSKDDVHVQAETISFDQAKNKFFSNGFVRIERGDSITTGTGLEATKDLSEVTVKRNVNITYKD